MAAYGLVVVICLASWYGVQAVDINVMPGLAVTGKYFVQHVTTSLTTGAGGIAPGGGRRRSLLQAAAPGSFNATPVYTATGQAAGTAQNINDIFSSLFTGRKLLATAGLEIDYAAKKSLVTGRVTVLLEFPSTPGNLALLKAVTTQAPTGAITPPATFFNAEVAYGTTVAVSKTGFLPASGGFVRARLTFDLPGNVLPALQFSLQYATNLAPPQNAFFFLNADTIAVEPDKNGLPTIRGLIDTLNF